MSARDEVAEVIREALERARLAGRIRSWAPDEHEQSLEVEVVQPGIVLAEAQHFITVDIYEETHL